MAYLPPQMPQQAEPDADDRGKLTHAEVRYGMAKPGGDRCATCKFYRGPNDCELVQSPIYPAGWCDKFQAAEANAQPGSAAQPMPAAASSGQMPAAATAGGKAAPSVALPLAHGRAIAGAKALHAVGHITPAERDKHIDKSQAALRKGGRKPFGSFSP